MYVAAAATDANLQAATTIASVECSVAAAATDANSQAVYYHSYCWMHCCFCCKSRIKNWAWTKFKKEDQLCYDYMTFEHTFTHWKLNEQSKATKNTVKYKNNPLL